MPSARLRGRRAGAVAGGWLGRLGCLVALTGCATTAGPVPERIVLIRHGEKPKGGLGQLACQGLNRALALPDVLFAKYPDVLLAGADEKKLVAFFAPDPSWRLPDGLGHGDPTLYSYVRPLTTIEPTAIRAGMRVSTQIGALDVGGLQAAVTSPQYRGHTVFIAWEHVNAVRFARQFLASYHEDTNVVPAWSDDDYDMMFVFNIVPPTTAGGQPGLSFQVDHEGLNGLLSDTCPRAAGADRGTPTF